MIDVYWTGVVVVSLIAGGGALFGIMWGLMAVQHPIRAGEAKHGARIMLAAIPTAAAFTFAWPILVPLAVVAAVCGLWVLADLPRPHLPRPHLPRRRRKPLVDQDYIERLERELGIGDDR